MAVILVKKFPSEFEQILRVFGENESPRKLGKHQDPKKSWLSIFTIIAA
jgi:hypothetical protein